MKKKHSTARNGKRKGTCPGHGGTARLATAAYSFWQQHSRCGWACLRHCVTTPEGGSDSCLFLREPHRSYYNFWYTYRKTRLAELRPANFSLFDGSELDGAPASTIVVVQEAQMVVNSAISSVTSPLGRDGDSRTIEANSSSASATSTSSSNLLDFHSTCIPIAWVRGCLKSELSEAVLSPTKIQKKWQYTNMQVRGHREQAFWKNSQLALIIRKLPSNTKYIGPTLSGLFIC
ncbi:hypothetical protein Pelo_15672 [Pelomyxa schiedti]|nr:hypothetical protein Pelo_15672 [Pelomyxa schiedti]